MHYYPYINQEYLWGTMLFCKTGIYGAQHNLSISALSKM